MSVEDETWDRPICPICQMMIRYGEQNLHGEGVCISAKSPTTVTWYLARAHDGTFSRGESWVDDLADARLYRSIGPAKSAVTKRAKQHPDEPIAEILEWKLDIATATVLDQTARTQKAVERIQQRKEADLRREFAYRREQLERELREKTAELWGLLE